MWNDVTAIEDELARLARATRFPPTPPLAPALRRRLDEARHSPAPPPAGRWAIAGFSLASAIVVLAALVATVTPARDAMGNLLERIRIYETSAPLTNVLRDIEGTEIRLDQAAARLGTPVRLPGYPEGSVPERVLFQDFGRVKTVVLFFRHPDGTPFALFETNGLVAKGVAPGSASAQPVSGLGQEAYWLEGWHVVRYEDVEGRPVLESARATNLNTLVWADDGLVHRIEGALALNEAIAIAQSVTR